MLLGIIAGLIKPTGPRLSQWIGVNYQEKAREYPHINTVYVFPAALFALAVGLV